MRRILYFIFSISISIQCNASFDYEVPFNYSLSNLSKTGSYYKELQNPKVALLKLDFMKNVDVLNLLDGAAKMKLMYFWSRSEGRQFYSELRRKDPVHALKLGKFAEKLSRGYHYYLITKNKDVKKILNDNETFTVGIYGEVIDKVVGPYMLGHEKHPPGNENLNMEDEKRKMRHHIFNKADMSLVKKISRQETNKGLAIKDKYSAVDVVKNISRNVPIAVIQDFFGFKASTKLLKKWSRATQHAFFHNISLNPFIYARAISAGKEMKVFIENTLIPQIKKNIASGVAKNDVISRLIKATEHHKKHGLDETRLTANIMGLLVGAVETTSAAITQSLEFFLDHPFILDKAAEAARSGNDKLLGEFIWEALRFSPVNPWVARKASKNVIIGGKEIKKGSLVLASTLSAMFDDDSINFKEPNKFKLNRYKKEGKDKYSFFHLGYGRHRCLGDEIGRAMVIETLKNLLILPNLRRLIPGDRISFKQKGLLKGSRAFPEKFLVIYGKSNGKRKKLNKFWRRRNKIFTKNGKLKNKIYRFYDKAELSKFTAGKIVKYYDGPIGRLRTIAINLNEKNSSSVVEKKSSIIDFSKMSKEVFHSFGTAGELKEACMDYNLYSNTNFKNIFNRAQYCSIGIDFRSCFALSRNILKLNKKSSIHFCGIQGKFLHESELKLVRKLLN